MIIKVNGQFTSFAYTMIGGSIGLMSGKLDRYNIDVIVDWSKKIGYESSGGNGSLRIYSDTPGDSQSYAITAIQGCSLKAELIDFLLKSHTYFPFSNG